MQARPTFQAKTPIVKFNTTSLITICAQYSKDMDMQFLLIISRQVYLPSASSLQIIFMSKSYGVFCEKHLDFGNSV